MKFTFIVPMLNEERNIGRCLESILQLNIPKNEYEVIAVDNGSTDNTCFIVESFANRMNLQLLEIPEVNISGLRNSGALRSKGDYLGFIDADCTVPHDWVDHIMDYLQRPDIGVVGCTYKVPSSSWVALAWDLKNEKRRRLGEVSFVPAGGLAVSKKNFLRIKGFDERLVTNEDCDLCFRLKRANKKIWSVPHAAVTHWGVPKTLREFFRRQRWHGKDVLKVFFQDLRSLNNLKAAMYAMYYIVVILLPLLFLPWEFFL
jgi:glycosyltransferase involved in cell wall biosynthesis